MIKRDIAQTIRRLSTKYPVVSVTGPRQSGKSTLLRTEFNDYSYTTLEDVSVREYATDDPKGFLQENQFSIIDEIQYVPSLFPYMQVITDQNNKTGEYIISGSQNFLLMDIISQSLAGRTGITKLLPFSLAELRELRANTPISNYIYTGFYPRIYKKSINPTEFYDDYIATYLNKDLHLLLGIKNIATFNKFLGLCAARIGQPLNYANLAVDSGIDVVTVKSWLNILETSYIVYTLPPFYENIGKRLTKSPKLYFYDTGLACNLLGILNAQNISQNSCYGNLFENMVVSDIIKQYFNRKKSPKLYFYQDSNKNELDLIDCTDIQSKKGIEIKSTQTANRKHTLKLNKISDIIGVAPENRYVVYGGKEKMRIGGAQFLGLEEYAQMCAQ